MHIIFNLVDFLRHGSVRLYVYSYRKLRGVRELGLSNGLHRGQQSERGIGISNSNTFTFSFIFTKLTQKNY